MKWGNFELFEINAGNFRLDGGAMFGIVPKTLWQKKFEADSLNRILLSTRCLLVKNSEICCLIDTGMGTKWTEKDRSRFAIESGPSLETLLQEQAGVTPQHITHVILTHLHFDHAGGLTRFNPDTQALELTFPNAEVLVQAQNLKTAENPNARERVSYQADNWQLPRSQGQLRLIESKAMELKNVLPGVHVQRSDGHTFGQQIVHLEGARGEHLVFCADLIPTSGHLSEAYVMGYDLQPLVLMEEKKQLLHQAAQNKWWLYFEHDPVHALGRADRVDRGAGFVDFVANDPLIHHLSGISQIT